MTFEHCAEANISANEIGWRNAKHRQQWRNTLRVYAYPTLGRLPVHTIDEPLVIKVLQPVWNVKPETADRLTASPLGHSSVVFDMVAVNPSRD